MKILIAFACVFFLFRSVNAEDKEVFQDNFLAVTSYEELTLGEIYLALPYDFFDFSYRERIELLISGHVGFDSQKKSIYVPGDGGQSRITAIVQKQTKDELILDVSLQHESTKWGFILKREQNRWVGAPKAVQSD